MRNIKYISLIVLLLSPTINSQLLAPLNLNNSWIYEDELGDRNKETIVDTAFVIDSIKYCKVRIQTYNSMNGYNEYIRLNQDSFYVWWTRFGPSPYYDSPYYKKNAQLGDIWSDPYDSSASIEVTNIFPSTVFGISVNMKVLKYIGAGGLVEIDRWWTEEFGRHNAIDFWGVALDVLKGCIINEVAYGDTNFYLTSVKNEETEVNKFLLYQNYPNPFNPSTIIKYNLPTKVYVKLNLYNNIGEKVKLLISEEQNAGNYEYNFNTDNLPSGVYFYQLSAGNYVQTMKMILMK